MNFGKLSATIARKSGSPWAFIAALALVIGWAISGPFFGFSDFWLLIINTITTIVTFLMVFLIQASGNRDTAEIKALLKELVEDLHEVDEVRAAARVADELAE